jgi:REP element-mobilizing transposase RayT
LAWCLMSNHVHLIAVPGRLDSLSVLMRRVPAIFGPRSLTRNAIRYEPESCVARKTMFGRARSPM